MLERKHSIRSLTRTGTVLAAVAVAVGCGHAAGPAGTPAAKPPRAAAAPPPVHGAQARAAHAVGAFADALRNGDVARLCRPGAVFTAEVVAELNAGGETCEASVELSSALTQPPALTVTQLKLEPDLATTQVRVGSGSTIPLDIVRDGRRWLVSFSNGIAPITAITQHR